MTTHHIGGPQAPAPTHPFGDIRDVLEALPEHAGGTGYRTTDIFPAKHAWLRENVPDARSVFEFGALCGYFLVTALDACPGIERVSWVDSELHTPGSNEMAVMNLRWQWKQRGRPEPSHDGPIATYSRAMDELVTRRGRQRALGQYDLVHVDGEHTLHACLVDLTLALAMRPQAILVDDTKAIADVRSAVELFCDYLGLEPEYHETVNGFAVIRP